MTSDYEAIIALSEQYAEAYRTSDLDLFADAFDDDIILMLTDRPAVTGKKALVEHQREFWTRFEATMDAIVEEVEVREDLAFVRGTANLTLTPRGSGGPVTAPISWLNVDRKGKDGRWRMWRNIYNYDRPMNF